MLKTLDSIYATHFMSHGIALLIKEARSHNVRQGNLHPDEIYVDAVVEFDAATQDNGEICLRKDNLCVVLKEKVDELPETIKSRHVNRIGFTHKPEEERENVFA